MPTIASMTIGKKATRKTISTLEVIPKPNHTRKSGASATLGWTTPSGLLSYNECPGNATAPGAARGMRHLKLLLFRAAYNLPVTLGLARGVFARHGLGLEIAYTRGSQMVVDSLGAGDYDVGVLSADDVVYEVEAHGADLFMFMGLHGGILTLVARP